MALGANLNGASVALNRQGMIPPPGARTQGKLIPIREAIAAADNPKVTNVKTLVATVNGMIRGVENPAMIATIAPGVTAPGARMNAVTASSGDNAPVAPGGQIKIMVAALNKETGAVGGVLTEVVTNVANVRGKIGEPVSILMECVILVIALKNGVMKMNLKFLRQLKPLT